MKTIIEQLFALQQVEMGAAPDSPENQSTAQRLRKEIPAPILGHYDRLRARGKAGVALVRNGVCAGCHMRLPIGVYAELFHVNDVRLCDTCGRYLLLAPDEKFMEPAPKAEPKPPVKAKAVRKPRKRKGSLQAA